MRKSLLPLIFLTLFSIVNSLVADDWPQFQGPHSNGTSDEQGLLHSWKGRGPPELWSANLGAGFGGAAVSKGKVYLLDRHGDEFDVLRCFDLDSGKELWNFRHQAKGRLPHNGSRTVPTIDDEAIYGIGPFGTVYCIDRATHEPRWVVDLPQIYGATPPHFGYAQSPLPYGNLIIVAPMSDDVGLVALDKESGREIWRSEGVGTSHSTPNLIRVSDQDQIVFLSNWLQSGTTTGFDPKTGGLLWQYINYNIRLPIPAASSFGDGRIFLTGGYDAGSVLLSIDHTQKGRTRIGELFRISKGSQIHLPFFIAGHIYMMTNENSNQRRGRYENGGLMCLNLNGDEVWRTGNSPNFGRGNMIYADGMLIIQDGIDGTLRLVDPSPEGYRQMAEASIFPVEDGEDDQKMWAPMALSDGRLVLRSQSELKCVDLRSRKKG